MSLGSIGAAANGARTQNLSSNAASTNARSSASSANSSTDNNIDLSKVKSVSIQPNSRLDGSRASLLREQSESMQPLLKSKPVMELQTSLFAAKLAIPLAILFAPFDMGSTLAKITNEVSTIKDHIDGRLSGEIESTIGQDSAASAGGQAQNTNGEDTATKKTKKPVEEPEVEHEGVESKKNILGSDNTDASSEAAPEDNQQASGSEDLAVSNNIKRNRVQSLAVEAANLRKSFHANAPL